MNNNLQNTTPNMNKRLTKSRDRILSGVCGGFADYFVLDPTIVRLGYAAFTLFSGFFFGILFYIICAFVMPEN